MLSRYYAQQALHIRVIFLTLRLQSWLWSPMISLILSLVWPFSHNQPFRSLSLMPWSTKIVSFPCFKVYLKFIKDFGRELRRITTLSSSSILTSRFSKSKTSLLNSSNLSSMGMSPPFWSQGIFLEHRFDSVMPSLYTILQDSPI